MVSGADVRVVGVRKSYGGVAALAELDLELGPGITGLLGPTDPCATGRHAVPAPVPWPARTSALSSLSP